jgi:hypothetical protein
MKYLQILLALGLGTSLTQGAVAQTSTSGASRFPLIGITRGETLQINLVGFPPDPCEAQMSFEDSNGNPIGTAKTVVLQAGEAASLNIDGAALANSFGQRVELLPLIVVNPNAAPGACRATVEVYDDLLGATRVLVPGAVDFSASPDFGMLHVTVLQTVRLNIVAFPPDPCQAQIGFVDGNGALVGNSLKTVQLSGGQATYIDLPGAVLVTGLGQRARVRPVVAPDNAPGAPDPCVVSAEIYTDGFATTTVFIPPDSCDPASGSCLALR